MDFDTIYQLLAEYNEEELLYKNTFLNSRHTIKHTASELCTPDYSPMRFGDSFLDNKIHKNVYLSKHNRYTPPFEHDHEFFEIVYVLSGTCENKIFGEISILNEGDLCLMSPSVRHSLWTEEGLIINILMRRSTLRNVFSNLFHGHSIISDFFTNSTYLRDFATCLLFRTKGDTAIREQVLGMYYEQLHSDEYSENIISSMLMIFFNKLVRGYKNTAAYPQTLKTQNESVSQILGMIVNHSSDITLSALAKQLGYSVVYCSKYIKKITGYTFLELLTKVKLEKAKELLRNTAMSISEISSICGYENPENFNRAFRKVYGMPPSAFHENSK